MEIQPSINSGLQGFERAKEQIDHNAERIANTSVTSVIDEFPIDESAAPTTPEETVVLSEELISMKIAEHQARASANVIQTADEVIGTLIDTTA